MYIIRNHICEIKSGVKSITITLLDGFISQGNNITYEYFIRPYYESAADNYTVTDTKTYTFTTYGGTSLKQGVTYVVNVKNHAFESFMGAQEIELEPLPQISLEATASSITATLTGLNSDESSTTYNKVVWSIYKDESREQDYYVGGSRRDISASESSTSYTFTGLSPETQYWIDADVEFTEGNSSYNYIEKISGSITTKGATQRPAKFKWDNDKKSGETFNLTASEWTDLCDNINAVRAYKTKGRIGFIEVISGKTKFTAAIYNQVVNAINDMLNENNKLSKVEPGNRITAQCLNDIVTKINSIS